MAVVTYFLSIQVGDVRTLSPRKTQHGQVWIERSIEMESRMAHPCHGAVNKPSAMPSADVDIDGSHRETLDKYIYLHRNLSTVTFTKTAELICGNKNVQT